MVRRGSSSHRCSYPGCKGHTVYDLTLAKRTKSIMGEYIASDKKVVCHVYLCEVHGEDMADFLSAYEGKE